jgi:hypothetical protein
VVVVDSGGGGIKPTALMAAFLTVAAIDGSGNDGIFTTAFHDDAHHPRHHCHCPCPCPFPPLDRDRIVGGGVEGVP